MGLSGVALGRSPATPRERVEAIRGATFGSSSQAKKLAYRKRMPPYYPRQAVQARVSGTVYLLTPLGSS